jgi:ATP-binding cassette subfamily B protein
MLAGLVFLLVLQTGTVLAGPRLIAHGIDHGLVDPDRSTLDRAAQWFVLVALAAYLLGRITVWGISATGERILAELRRRVFDHLLALGLDYFDRERAGVIVSRMTSDIDALQQLLQVGLIGLVQNGLLFVGALVWIFVLSWQLALFVVVLLVPAYLGSRWFRRESSRAFAEVRDRIGRNLSNLQEGLAGVRVIQAYAQEESYLARFRASNEEQFDANLRTVKLSTTFFPSLELCGVVGTAVVLCVGTGLGRNGVVTVGTVAAFVLYLGNLFEPIQQFSQTYNTLQASTAALQKVFDLLDVEPSIAERPDAVDLPPAGELVVSGIGFRYGEGPEVLADVTLTVAPGERLALVGPTGAGKSTLAKLMARCYDPVGGSVAFGGVDLRDASLRSLRHRIVVVPQEGFLFNGTVRDNIRFGRPGASDADVEGIVASLGMTSWFAQLPDGLDTEVRERGSRLSAGERQLVSLARAALADPVVLVLDEATSNLDPGTESLVERALERLTAGRTVILVAHRLSTTLGCDRIGVVDGGRLVELGGHAELRARGGQFARLYQQWLAAEPAATGA